MDLQEDDAVVAGLAADETAAGDLISALRAIDIELHAIHVGAADRARAQALAAAHQVLADVAPDDPLAGAPGLGNATGHRIRIDRGGTIGAVVGAVAGVAFGMLPIGRFITTLPEQAPLIDGLLFFVAGGISGAVLGGAFGPQLSTFAGFRLIDGMDEGSIAVLVRCSRAQSKQIREIFDSEQAADVVGIGAG